MIEGGIRMIEGGIRMIEGGIRMIDVETMIKALRLAWIPRLFVQGRKNWKTIPGYYLGRYRGLNFLFKM